MRRRPLLLAVTLLAALGSLLPGPAAAKRRPKGPAVAVWDVYADDEHRAEAWYWYARISDAIDSLPELRADQDLDFLPDVAPAEGITFAVQTASRWLEASWVAFRGREYEVARGLAQEAQAMIEGYQASRLPDGLPRDLELMVARCELALGRTAQATRSMRAAALLDPTWDARPEWEKPEFLAMWQGIAAERAAAPPGTLIVRSDQPYTRVLVYGIDQGGTGKGGQVELQLPPGIYEVSGRKPGYADRTEQVHLRAHDVVEIDLAMEVRNSPAFQEGLLDALIDPGSQRRSGVWAALDLARCQVEAEAVLVGRYEVEEGQEHGALLIGLFLPGRGGWGFYRRVELEGNLGRDQLAVEAAVQDLLVALDTAMSPDAAAVSEAGE